MTNIEITDEAWKYISDHAGADYPRECCGVLIGTAGDKGISRAKQLINFADVFQGGKRFISDPLEYLEIERQAEIEGNEIRGFYHSHPEGPARYSEEDEAHFIPGMIYLIASVCSIEEGMKTGIRAARAFVKKEPDGTVSEIGVLKAGTA